MIAVVDTTILVGYLRRDSAAKDLVDHERAVEPLHASEMTRVEILSGMRSKEESGTLDLLSTLIWHPVDQEIAELAGEMARRWLPSHHTIGIADFVIAATTFRSNARLLTLNVKHFPMIAGLVAPY